MTFHALIIHRNTYICAIVMDNSIKKYQFRPGLPLEFEIVDLEKILRKKNEMMVVPHRAQFYHILWIEKGKGTHYVDFKPIELSDNTLIFIASNSVNIYDKLGEYHGKSIIFTNEFFCKNEQDMQFLHSSILYSDLYPTAVLKTPSHFSDLQAVYNAMETEFNRQNDRVQFGILHNMLHVLLLQAERELRKQGFKELVPGIQLENLIQFKAELEKYFSSDKSVSSYAAKLGLSEKQLHKACTSIVAKTPKQIIDERVVLEAKRLLAHSNQSIKEIAYELGYEEPTNFIKYFRKHSNCTPLEFREQYQS